MNRHLLQLPTGIRFGDPYTIVCASFGVYHPAEMLAAKIGATVLAALGGAIAVGQVVRRMHLAHAAITLMDQLVSGELAYLVFVVNGFRTTIVIAAVFIWVTVIDLLGLPIPLLDMSIGSIWERLLDGAFGVLILGTALRLLKGASRWKLLSVASVLIGAVTYFMPFVVTKMLCASLCIFVFLPAVLMLLGAVAVGILAETENMLRNRSSATSVSVALLFISALIQIWLLAD